MKAIPYDPIARLAAQGEPCVFYSRFAAPARNAFLTLCSSGKSCSEAAAEALIASGKIYRAYVANPPKESTAEWFEAHLRQYLPESSTAPAVSAKITEAEIVEFDARFQTLIQREYGKTRQRKSRVSAASKFMRAVHDNWLLRTALIAAACIALAIGGWLYLVTHDARLALSYQSAKGGLSLVTGASVSGLLSIRRGIPSANAPALAPHVQNAVVAAFDPDTNRAIGQTQAAVSQSKPQAFASQPAPQLARPIPIAQQRANSASITRLNAASANSTAVPRPRPDSLSAQGVSDFGRTRAIQPDTGYRRSSRSSDSGYSAP
jgi:hypothetical protein